MRKEIFRLLLLFLFFCPSTCPAQNSAIDSLKNSLQVIQSDTSRIKTLYELSKRITDKQVWPAYNQAMLDLAEKNLKELSLHSPLHSFYSRYKAAAFNNAGFLAYETGDIPKALDNHAKALKIREAIGDQKGIATSLNNIASIYYFQHSFKKAREFYNRSLEIRSNLGDKNGMIKCLNNIALIQLGTDSVDHAIQSSKKALELAMEVKDQYGTIYSYCLLGMFSHVKKDYTSSLAYYTTAEKMGPLVGTTLGDIAGLYLQMDSLDKAANYGLRALSIIRQEGNPIFIRNMADLMKAVYVKQHKPAEALEMYELYTKMHDSIYNIENQKSTMKSQLQYDFDKKEMLMNEAKARQALVYEETARRNKLQFEFEQTQASLKNEEEKQQLAYDENLKRLKLNEAVKTREAAAKAEQEKKEVTYAARNKQKIMLIYGIVAGLIMVSVFSFYLFRRFRITQRQKAIIEKQKDLVEEHRKEIIDSITYAKRLQQAILPPIEEIKKSFPESFLLYKPKDIVAGDFYWLEQFNDVVYIAAADCTGHGVPGAMVSIVCSNALNRAVKEFGLRDTGSILDKTRELVLETFAKSNSEVKDGMDISLLAVNRNENKVHWSGANNQLWYIKNDEMQEITACKQPIGKIDNPKPFQTHLLEPRKGMIFYLMTDGYPDQFGGPKGKKYKYKPLQEMLVLNRGKPLDEQQEILSTAFADWKGELEQVDDVTIIGLKF